jgi:hypothetical protein
MNCLATHRYLKTSIAEKLASVANDSVSQFFDRRGSVETLNLPLMSFLKAVKSKRKTQAFNKLLFRFPWLTETDLALAKFRIDRDGRLNGVDPTIFFSEVAEDLELIQSNLESITHVTLDPLVIADEAIFTRILHNLSPYTLHQLEKYLIWKGDAESKAQLNIMDEAWRGLCVKHEINVLRNQDKLNHPIHNWKSYFIARYFKRSTRQSEGQKDVLALLVSLCLLFDNKDLLKESQLIKLADIEMDTR